MYAKHEGESISDAQHRARNCTSKCGQTPTKRPHRNYKSYLISVFINFNVILYTITPPSDFMKSCISEYFPLLLKANMHFDIKELGRENTRVI